MRHKKTGLWFVAPALVVLAVFAFWPVLRALALSLYESNGLGAEHFVGLGQFRELAGDALFAQSFKVLGFLLVFGTPLGVLGPLVGAKLIHAVRSGRSAFAYRVMFVLPLVVPGMVTILVWRELYAIDGAVNRILEAVGWAEWANTWIGNDRTVLPALIFMGVPWVGGVSMLIYLAGLMNIPASLYEALELEGAGPMTVFARLELPLIVPQIRLVLVMALIGSIQAYENILVLTDGGPGNASLVPALYLFKNGFSFGRLGYASAIGVVLFAITFFLTLVNMRVLRGEGASE